MTASRAIFSPYRCDTDIFSFIGKVLQQNEIRFEERFRLNIIEVFKSTMEVNKETSERLMLFITKLYDKISELEKLLQQLDATVRKTPDFKDANILRRRFRMIKILLGVIETQTKEAAETHDKLFPPTILQPVEQTPEPVEEQPVINTEIQVKQLDILETVKTVKLLHKDALPLASNLSEEIVRICNTINGSSKERVAARAETQSSKAIRAYNAWAFIEGDKSPAVAAYLAEVNKAAQYATKKLNASRTIASAFANNCYTAVVVHLETEKIFVPEAANFLAKAFKLKNIFAIAWLTARLRSRDNTQVDEAMSYFRQIRQLFENADFGQMAEYVRMREAFAEESFLKTIFGQFISYMGDLKNHKMINERLEALWPIEHMRKQFEAKTEETQEQETLNFSLKDTEAGNRLFGVSGQTIFKDAEIAEIITSLPTFKTGPLSDTKTVVAELVSIFTSKFDFTNKGLEKTFQAARSLIGREGMKVNITNFGRGQDNLASQAATMLAEMRRALEGLEVDWKLEKVRDAVLSVIEASRLNITDNQVEENRGIVLEAVLYLQASFYSAQIQQDVVTAFCIMLSELKAYVLGKKDPELLRKVIVDREAMDFNEVSSEQFFSHLKKRRDGIWSTEKMKKDLNALLAEIKAKEKQAVVIQQPIQKEIKEVSKETPQNKREIVNLAFQEFTNSSTMVYNFLESLSVRNAEKFDEHLETFTTAAAKLMPHLRVEIVGEEKVSDQLSANFVKLANRCVDLYKDYPNTSVSNLIGIIVAFEKTVEVLLTVPEPEVVKPQITKASIEPSVTDLDVVIGELYKVKQRLQDLAK